MQHIASYHFRLEYYFQPAVSIGLIKIETVILIGKANMLITDFFFLMSPKFSIIHS